MPNHSLKRQLKVLTIPVFIEMALVMLLGAVDTVMLSRYSDNSVAAVGLDNQLMSLVFLVYQFFSMGVAILCAQYIGAGLRKRLVQAVGMALVINLMLSLSVSALLFFYAEQLLQLMGLRPELMDDGLVYLRLTGALSFFQALSLTFSASLRSADKVVYPMVVTGIVNVLNIIGNYALIFGRWGCPQLGVEGAAIATATSRIIAMVLLACIHFKVHIPRFPLRYFRPIPWQELRNLLYIGIPAMSENISYCLSQVVVTYFINQISNEALATRTYCYNMIMFVYLFCLSITQGGDILVGHLVGQQRHQAAYVLGNYFYRWSMVITLMGSALLALSGRSILSAFTDNQEIITVGVWVLVVDWFLEIGRTSNIFAVGTLRATGDAIYPVVIAIIFNWTIAVGVGYFIGIPLGYGLIGMWIGFALDENIRGVILLRRWRSGKWKSKGFVKNPRTA
ncbi:putative efflux protein, MATE family [Xylanibacter ruminicola]|jgi:putative MATE family efflux protein|uniref:Putative efflux protein, MATE family n=1 Tax=Xylanibacter ruminicola TaxID=839 RepID=A0A1H5XHS7_XYLRU|nr:MULTISPECIES: MATE family efflux transporter [Prevotellaceae]SEG10947.1 putative efflux protein, MATE family [Xylanibacter ruminicola]